MIYDMKVRCECNSFTQSMNFEFDDRQRFIGRTLILNVRFIVGQVMKEDSIYQDRLYGSD
jgi:hypothetical protein